MSIKLLLLPVVFSFFMSGWTANLADAVMVARKEHKHILLNFSGSDWCGPCIRMRQEIFESSPFRQMADSELVLVNADFPRNKKNQLSAEQQKINNETADKFNPKGLFPFTLLLNSDGKILGAWEGLPNESPEAFIADIHKHMYNELN